MLNNPVINLIGRRLRLGLIGGGGAGMIGPVHRQAARLDDRYEIVAGVLSSRPEVAKTEAQKLGISRAYSSPQEMIDEEAKRDDGIDLVAIMTPDDTHVPYTIAALEAGLDVICEKPLSNNPQDLLRLQGAADKSKALLCVMHNYSGFAMVREAREAVATGELGRIQLVQVNFVMGNLGARLEDNPEKLPDRLKWRLDPKRGGESHALSDLGSHAYHLAGFITGQDIGSVCADLGAAVAGRTVHDTAALLLRMRNGARGTLFVSKAASGAQGGLSIEVYGDKGGLRWELANSAELKVMKPGQPYEIRTASLPALHPYTKHSLRGVGGAGAFIDAFANIYSDFASQVAARKAGVSPDPLAMQIPGLKDGIAGLRFIEACIASSKQGGWVDLPES